MNTIIETRQATRLRRLLHADLARFAGGSATTEPFGLLADALEDRRGGG